MGEFPQNFCYARDAVLKPGRVMETVTEHQGSAIKHRALEKVLNQITSILLIRLRLSFVASIAPIPAQRVTKNAEKKSDESPRLPKTENNEH